MVFNDGVSSDEKDDIVLKEMGVRKIVTEEVTKEVEEVQRDVKYSSISSYISKRPYFLTQLFKDNNKTHDKLLNNVYDFGVQTEWRSRKRAVNYYLDVDTRKYQEHLPNPITLDYITGCVM